MAFDRDKKMPVVVYENTPPKTDSISGLPKIISETVSEEEKKRYFISVKNPFSKERPRTEKPELRFVHPEVKEFREGKKPSRPNDWLTVRYVNWRGQLVEARWRACEYLKRIGFKGDFNQGKKPFEKFLEFLQSKADPTAAMREAHQKIIEGRINRAFAFDQKLEAESQLGREGRIFRKRQLRSQYEEDPYFVRVLEGSGYIYPLELPVHHDYIDAIDVLVEIDPSDFEEDWQEEPIYLGVQRTLLEKGRGRLWDKEEKIKKAPLWYVPEYPERNPVLRVLYRENPSEYYLEDGTSRFGMLEGLTREENRKNPKRAKEKGAKLLPADRVILGNTEEEVRNIFYGKDELTKKRAQRIMIAKTLDVLYQALDNILEYQKDKTRTFEIQKVYAKYERGLRKIISIVEEDTGLSREAVKKAA